MGSSTMYNLYCRVVIADQNTLCDQPTTSLDLENIRENEQQRPPCYDFHLLRPATQLGDYVQTLSLGGVFDPLPGTTEHGSPSTLRKG
ncbi:jg25114 [Pararge aegeria aegeria]|uniref:Jg25114 protein n=1 Tax=Pararge aegeria aegeria TaxID=348720 RepID=A0A8S4RYB3_9NEOP|nr:jg25114 [Pararge aegeria aegeria]